MNSKTYWQRREAEALKHRITDEREYDRQIKRIYSSMLDACQKEINAFYGKYAAKEGITIAEAKKRVKKADIAEFERKAKRYVRDKDFSAQANEEMRLYNTMMKVNRLEMLKANIGLEMIAGHDELERFMSGILKGRTEDELKRQAGILGKTVLQNARKAEAIVNASFHNATFSDRVWMYQDLLKDELDKLLQSGLIQGKNPRQLAIELKKKFAATTHDAERLMRTELARVQTDAQKQSFERNGFDKYIFIVNGGCCPICEGIANKKTKYGKGVYLVSDMMPGKNAPPVHPHCRCSTAAWEDGEEYEAWLDYIDKGGTTAEWEKIKQKAGGSITSGKKGLEKSDNSDIIKESFGYSLISGAHTIEDDIGTSEAPTCNPHYSTGDERYAENCCYSSATFEMRRRGFDVVANPSNTRTVQEWLGLFENAKPIYPTSKTIVELAKELKQKLLEMGNGARGSIFVEWKGRDVGHFFSWEVKDGDVWLVDAQSGDTDVSRYLGQIEPTKTICVRWDDLKPSDKIRTACKKR